MLNFKGKSPDLPTNCTFLYKVYDNLGCLLYVGQTKSVSKRFKTRHNKYAIWRNTYTYVEIEGFDSRTAAMAEETRCILFERPLYNLSVNNRPWSYKDGVMFGPSNSSKLKESP